MGLAMDMAGAHFGQESVADLLLALRRRAPELGAVHRGTALHRLAKAGRKGGSGEGVKREEQKAHQST